MNYALCIKESDTAMQIYNLTPGEAVVPKGSVLLFGCFDGVHRGHLALLNEAKKLAAADPDTGTKPVVVWVIDKRNTDFITPMDEKCALFGQYGADLLITEEFSAIRSLSGAAFFEQFVASFEPYAVVCGFNFRFGVQASSSAADMRNLAQAKGIRCSIVPPLMVDEQTVSSTAVRSAVASGDIQSAVKLLGRPLSYTSEVLHGNRLGRTIGHPTINQRIPAHKITPPFGVYSCTVTYEENGETVTKGGVCNIGSRPTVNDDERDVTLETFLFDFSGDLYGVTVTTALCEMIRPERRFSDIDALREQIERDAETAWLSLKSCGAM